jgi:hypothetical protein
MKSISLAYAMLLLSTLSFAQKTLLTGKILRMSTNEPVIGANVNIKGTNRGTITDQTGQYVLNVTTQKVILVISYKKMRTIEYEVDTQGMLKKVYNFEMTNKYDLGRLLTKKKEQNSDIEVLSSNN